MDRIDRIMGHPVFVENLQKNKAAETGRDFCRHDMVHFLDVARIGTIISLERCIPIDRELIYGAALLHDIGKHRQYEEGIPHEQASASIAAGILADCGFTRREMEMVTKAIEAHRDASVAGEKSLKGILYLADKASRPCFSCEAEPECNWKGDKKNLKVRY